MNYYERHLGDYARDTGHLSLLEHGVYTILLDRYYITEQGIPDAQKYRLARARTDEERKAVDDVLSDFFELIEKPTGFLLGSENERVWVNHRADEEIEKARIKINSSRENGKKGGRPRNNQEITQEKPTGFFLGIPEETQTKAHQTPDTKHQSPDKTPSDNKTHTIPENEVSDFSAGSVCVLLRDMGITHTNPSHPDLLAALGGGATRSDFEFAATEALNKSAGNGFAYLLKIVLKNLENPKHVRRNTRAVTTNTNSGFAEKYAGIG